MRYIDARRKHGTSLGSRRVGDAFGCCKDTAIGLGASALWRMDGAQYWQAGDKTMRVCDLETGQYPALAVGTAAWTATVLIARANRLIAGSATGEIVRFDLRGMECGPAVCTPGLLAGQRGLTVLCPWCAQLIEVPKQAADAIAAHLATLKPGQSPCLDLPEPVFQDLQLVANCSACARPIRFNPFFVGST